MSKNLVLVTALSFVVGCIAIGDDGDEGDDGLGEVASESRVSNGASVNGVSVNGASVNGVSVNGVSLVGSELTATTSGGAPLRGTQLVGAALTGTLSSGGTVPLRIDAATQLNGDVWAYTVMAKPGSTWTSICGAGVQAIAISGTWDYRDGPLGAGGYIADATKLTFACRGKGAIAKCIEIGYAPWRMVSGVSLRDYHTACVRMIRGDYCGTGHAYTQDGNLIDIYDRLGIQTDTETWPIDAEWTKAGARCIRKNRAPLGLPLACALKLLVPACGTFTSPQSLMVNEFDGPVVSL